MITYQFLSVSLTNALLNAVIFAACKSKIKAYVDNFSWRFRY